MSKSLYGVYRRMKDHEGKAIDAAGLVEDLKREGENRVRLLQLQAHGVVEQEAYVDPADGPTFRVYVPSRGTHVGIRFLEACAKASGKNL